MDYYLPYFCLVILSTITPNVYGQGNGALSLFRNGVSSLSYSFGIVRIYYNSAWGNICHDSHTGATEANVICHQLGYTGASRYGRASDESYGIDLRRTLISELTCSSDYQVVLQCSYRNIIILSPCTNNDDITVSCYTTRIWNNPYIGQVRLLNGSYITEGRIEIYCNGRWGTVCDDSFTIATARTVCIQLGYNSFSSWTSGFKPGASSQPIWLNRLICSSVQNCLSYCQRCPSLQDNTCVHSEDVYISCSYQETSIYSGSNITTCDLSGRSTSSASVVLFIAIGIIVGVSCIICLIVVISVLLCIYCCCGDKEDAHRSNRPKRTTVQRSSAPSVPIQMTTMSPPPSYAPPPPPPDALYPPLQYPPPVPYNGENGAPPPYTMVAV